MDRTSNISNTETQSLYYKFENLVFKSLNALIVLMLISMILLVFTNVVLRYGFNSGISISVELSRFLFVWICFLGAVNALIKNEHLAVKTLVDKLPKKVVYIVEKLTISLMSYCCYLFIDGSYKQAVINWTNISPISKIPNGVFYVAGVISGTLMLIILLHRLFFQNSGK